MENTESKQLVKDFLLSFAIDLHESKVMLNKSLTVDDMRHYIEIWTRDNISEDAED
jgi:hypothetical protein